jgi:outer membrane biosynthesis protein TonB
MFMLAVHSAGAQAKDTSTPPIIVELIKPDYPADARAAGVEGEVIVLVLVDKKGKVKVADAYGPMAPCSNLDDPLTASVRTAAVEAAKKAVFMPATFNGNPVDKGYTLKYIFDADNDDGKAAGRQNAFLTETGAPHVRRPVLLKVPKAKFPGGDAVGGIVDLRLLVYEDGRVHSVGPLSGHKAFRRAAMEAACKAVFQPAMVDGRPVKFQFLFRHNFYTVIERE